MRGRLCLALVLVTFAFPASADCDISTEARALNDRVLALRGPTREKQGKLATMYRTKMLALLKKRNLEGDAAKAYVADLRARMTKVTDAKAREVGNDALAKQALKHILRISELDDLPPEKACSEIVVIENAVSALFKRLASQLDEDHAAIEAILDEELSR